MWSIPTTHPTIVSHSGCVTVFTKPHRSQTIIRTPCRRQLFPATSIPAEEHTNRSASLRSTFRWKPRPKIPSHTQISGLVLKLTLFGHVPPPADAYATDEPIHPLRAPPPSEKPSFFTFSLRPLFLCFSVA